ncbi:MAG: PaaI family thioesterase [Betaproteobacteria bacterium]
MTTPEHPERALMRDIITRGLTEVPVTTNPLAIAVGMTIVEASKGRVRARFSVGEAFTQGNGVVQGGIVSALLDFGMAFAAFSSIPAGATIATVAQTTNFFRAARAGTLIVEATLEKTGRTMINARATLTGPDGKTLATATAPIAVLAHQPATAA